MKLFAAIVFSLWASLTWAQDAEIQAVIDGQIEAFSENDFAQAFSFASPDIQGFFGSSERFEAMVRGGYQMVIAPQEVRFLELRKVNGLLWQKVLLRDTHGRLHVLDYQMIQQENGWRINGVSLLTPEAAA